jgi:hypothetical protein
VLRACDEVTSATAQDFLRFLFRRRHVALGTQLGGDAGLVVAVLGTPGCEVAAAAWESALVARRLPATTRLGSTGCATTATSPGCA